MKSDVVMLKDEEVIGFYLLVFDSGLLSKDILYNLTFNSQ